jgi:PAS domain S-box-containing protein
MNLPDSPDEKRVEQELALRAGIEAAEEQLKMAVQAAGMGVWRVDIAANKHTTIQGSGPVSGLSADIYPHTVEQIFALIHPDDRESVNQSIQRAFETGQYKAEFRIVRPDTTVRWVSARGRCLRDPSGKPLVLTGVDVDVTERKRAEEALVREQIFTRAIFDSVPGLLYVYEENGRLVRWNKQHEEVTGYTAAELARMHLLDWFRGDEASTAQIKAAVHKVFSDGFGDAEAQLQTKHGPKYFYFTGVRLDIDGKTYLAGIGIDISARQRLEEQFRQAQKMEAIGQLAGGVAHDFNNLLTVVQGNASLLLDTKHFSESDIGLIRQITGAAERGAGLTRQLLLFGRKQMLQPFSVNLNAVVGNMAKMLHRILGEDITLESDFDPDLPAIRVDVSMIEQIILNLAVNARDAMPRGGSLRVATSAQTIGPGELKALSDSDIAPGTYVCLEVSDSGCGIAPEHRQHIFEPFFTTKAVGKGTGLGLATVYSIVKQHRGAIEVNSELERGTAFRIYLPAEAIKAPELKNDPADPRFPKGSETILVVEDEQPVRLLVSNQLQRFGYTVFGAANGPAALEIWNEHKDKIHLLLTDMVMPGGMTGRELAEKLRIEKPLLKVIYTSGYSTEILGKATTLVEGFNFLQKPYQSAKLAHAVRNCLDEG